MARILITSSTLPLGRSDGRRLRLDHFCRQLAARHECYLAVIGDQAAKTDPRSELGIRAYRVLDPVPRGRRSSRRLFRLSNARYLEFSHPEYLEETRRELTALCLEWRIDIIACLTIDTAEIVMPLAPPKLLDFCDSGSLTIERMIANRRGDLAPLERAKYALKRLRARQTESVYLRAFDHTITISSADREALLRSSGVSPDKVSVVPNGVAREALEAGASEAERLKSVVFWGHLDFPPNWTAVEYFYDEIFLPHLAPERVEWHIYGSGAGSRLSRLDEHPLIHIHGFVDSLYDEIRRHGVMVNPMVEGSGLKNKVLEAFACRLPVVSTSIGIEATGAVSKFHYLPGDSPEEFAGSVLEILSSAHLADELRANARRYVESNFAWDAIGEQLSDLLLDLNEHERVAVAQ
jgi:glycosyltransferase involved in cell wall biosynthesis